MASDQLFIATVILCFEDACYLYTYSKLVNQGRVNTSRTNLVFEMFVVEACFDKAICFQVCHHKIKENIVFPIGGFLPKKVDV